MLKLFAVSCAALHNYGQIRSFSAVDTFSSLPTHSSFTVSPLCASLSKQQGRRVNTRVREYASPCKDDWREKALTLSLLCLPRHSSGAV